MTTNHYHKSPRGYRGAIAVPDSESEYVPIPSAWRMDNESLKKRIANFLVARGDTKTACQLDPVLFEGSYHGEGVRNYEYRVRVARALCDDCPLFDPCLRMSMAVSLNKPEITGVVAGYLHDPTPAADRIRKRLQMEKVMANDVILAPAQDA